MTSSFGCVSLSSTGMVTTSPARTIAVSSFTTGWRSWSGAGIGITTTLALGRLRAVRDAVLDAGLIGERALVGDAEGLMVDDRHRDTGVVLDRDGLHDEDAAGGVDIVREHAEEHISARGQQCDVTDGDRRQIRLARLQHVDALRFPGCSRTRGREIQHVVGAGGVGGEGEGLVGSVRQHGRAGYLVHYDRGAAALVPSWCRWRAGPPSPASPDAGHDMVGVGLGLGRPLGPHVERHGRCGVSPYPSATVTCTSFRPC